MSLVPRGTNELSNPWIQAGRLAFLALYAVTVLAALAWMFANVQQIEPQDRAVFCILVHWTVSRTPDFYGHGLGLWNK